MLVQSDRKEERRWENKIGRNPLRRVQSARPPGFYSSSVQAPKSPRSAVSLTSAAGELRPPSGTMSTRSHPAVARIKGVRTREGSA